MGFLHRDIKPTNLMLYKHLGEPDFVKVLDFGIAKLFGQVKVGPSEHARTKTGVVVGTPRYIAPEIIEGGSALPASDLYALGLLCYELLTGHHANRGKTPLEIISFQVSPEPILLPQELLIPGPTAPDHRAHDGEKSGGAVGPMRGDVIEALRREKLGEAYDAQVFEQTVPSMRVSEELLGLPIADDAATSEYNALSPAHLAPTRRSHRVSEPLPPPPRSLGESLSEPSDEILLDQGVAEIFAATGHHPVARPQGVLPLEWDKEDVTDVSRYAQAGPGPKEERLIVLTQKKRYQAHACRRPVPERA